MTSAETFTDPSSYSGQPLHPKANRLLSLLPDEECERLLPLLESVSLKARDVFYNPNEPIWHVYFPLTCVGSLINLLDGGGGVEFGTVGHEGMVGLPVALGANSIPSQAICQIDGAALRMRADDLREEMSRVGPLHRILLRYSQALFNQMAQTAACNRLHPVEERCSRWLLMTHDRVGHDEFRLTQEFLAAMLGVRRATVTVAAGILQEAGLIRYRRGIVTIVDRERLESSSCECYRVIRDDYERIMGEP